MSWHNSFRTNVPLICNVKHLGAHESYCVGFFQMQDSQGVLEAHYEEEKQELEKKIKTLESENSIIFDNQDEWRKKVQQVCM